MTTRSKDTVQNDLARWERQRAAIQQRLAHLAALERQGRTPAERVEAAQEQRKLEEQLEIIAAKMAPLQDELDAIDRKEAADLAAIEELRPRGEENHREIVAARDVLKAKMQEGLALEAAGLQHTGAIPWRRVFRPLLLAINQAEQADRFLDSMEEDRLERIERQAQREQAEKPSKPAASGAVSMWEDLRGRLGRAAREGSDGTG